jgi:PrcB C-terminal
VEIRTIKSGSNAAARQGSRQAMLANNAEIYARLWSSLIGSETAPSIDFSSECAVFLLAGQRNTGGYSIQPNGAALDGETLVIDATVQGPPPGSIVTQALTYPYVVIAVKTRSAKDVRWQP